MIAMDLKAIGEMSVQYLGGWNGGTIAANEELIWKLSIQGSGAPDAGAEAAITVE